MHIIIILYVIICHTLLIHIRSVDICTYKTYPCLAGYEHDSACGWLWAAMCIYIYTCYILKYFTYLLILARCPTWPSQAMHFICKALYDIVFISLIINRFVIIEGSLEVKLPTVWRDGKAEVGRVREEKIRDGEDQRGRKSEEKREDTGARNGRKVAIHCVFPMIWGSGGSKSNVAKAAGAEPAGQMRDEKLHAVVARSTFPSQNAQNISTSDHFWKLRCRKSARCCDAKHISKSKCTKHFNFGPLLEVEMSKKCTLLWREAHFQVKMHKTLQIRTTFGRSDVEKGDTD